MTSDYDVARCDVDVLDCEALSSDDFRAHYLGPNRPALLAGCAGGWAATQRWAREELVRRYGDVRLQVGRVAFPATYGLPTSERRLADIAADAEEEARRPPERGAREAPEFAFDAGIVEKTGGRISADFPALPFTGGAAPVLTEFGLGPPLSGANMHFHGAALAALVHGRKRWALVPPRHAYFDLRPGRDWFDSDAPREPWVKHCVQRAGDVLFVPRSWGHAVLNLQTSVAIVNEYP